MLKIDFDPIIKEAAPEYRALILECNVETFPTSDNLWQLIEELSFNIRDKYELQDINKRDEIAALRQAYKKFGKDPNRYRPSSDALSRRIVKGMHLYRSLNIIDLINYLSVKYGNSIGGFDTDKIQGDKITLGVGREKEPYNAIGRGELNISGLPVWRDLAGGIGTPTSDNERTKITPSTKRLLMTIHIFDPNSSFEEIKDETIGLLEKYANASSIQIALHIPS